MPPLSDTDKRIANLQRQIDDLRSKSLQYPLDPLNRRIVNRDLMTVKSVSDPVFNVVVNDRPYTLTALPDQTGNSGEYLTTDGTTASWAAVSGGSGGKSVTLIVGPAANSDSAGYDYTTDGTADDVQIQAAIDALTGGGTILLREGTYTLDAQVNLDNADTIIRGVGDGTLITPKTNFAFATTEMFNITGARCVIENLKVDGNDANQTDAGSFFYVDAADVSFIRCSFVDAYGYVAMVNANTTTFYKCRFVVWGSEGSGFQAIEHDNALTHTVLNVLYCYFETTDADCGCIDEAEYGSVILGNVSVIPASLTGVWFNVCGGATIGNYFSGGATLGASAVIIYADSGWGVVQGNYLDMGGNANVTSAGIQLVGAAALNNYITGVGRGIYGGYTIKGNYIEGTSGHGIYVTDSNSIIEGNIVEDAGQATDNTYDGIFINSAVDRCIINGNRVWNNSAADQRYSINISAATCDNNLVVNNICTDAQTGEINDAGTGTVSANNIIT